MYFNFFFRTMKSKNPKLLAPLLPLGFLTAYHWDMAYNDKMERIKRKELKFYILFLVTNFIFGNI